MFSAGCMQVRGVFLLPACQGEKTLQSLCCWFLLLLLLCGWCCWCCCFQKLLVRLDHSLSRFHHCSRATFGYFPLLTSSMCVLYISANALCVLTWFCEWFPLPNLRSLCIYVKNIHFVKSTRLGIVSELNKLRFISLLGDPAEAQTLLLQDMAVSRHSHYQGG